MSGKYEAPAVIGAGKLNTLQALRALAAALVTVAHASEEAKYYFGFAPYFETDPFGKGVDLFFVLSGFIIYYSWAHKGLNGPVGAKNFMVNRFLRVAPLYYLFTTLMVLVLIFAPSGVKEARLDWAQIATSYVFLPYERYDGRIAPILSLGWTLNYELFFYALFAICLVFRPKSMAKTLIAVITGVAVIGVLVPKTAPAPLEEWSDSIILEFAFGVCIAWFYCSKGRIKGVPVYLTAIAIAGSLAAMYFLNLPPKPFGLPRFMAAGVPAAITVACFVLLLPDSLERIVPRWVVAMGDSSYSLYLSHRFIQRPIQILFKKMEIAGISNVGYVYLSVSVASAFLFGYFIYRTIETPLLGFLKRKISDGNVG